jgi:hypothetical protein
MAPSPSQAAGEPVRDRVTVDVPFSRERAVDRTMVAFIAESLTVARNEGGVITSEPVILKSLGVDNSLITYTATVVPTSDSSARVVVMAYEQDLKREGYAGMNATADARKKPITSHYRAMYIPFWQRVERIAARLKD